MKRVARLLPFLGVLSTMWGCGSSHHTDLAAEDVTAHPGSEAPSGPDAGTPPAVLGGGDAGAARAGQACTMIGETRPCFPFTTGKAGVGACKEGQQTCEKAGEFGALSACTGAIGPAKEICGNAIDDDCDGVVDNGCETPVKAQMEFHRLDDTAAWTNCLKIQVNGGPEVDLGCNHGPLMPPVEVTVNAPPFCNVVRLNLYSNGTFNKSTKDPNDAAHAFVIKKVSNGNFEVKCDDNGDGDFNDLNLTMNALGSVLFTIENSGIACN